MKRATLQRKTPMKSKGKLNAKRLPALSESSAAGMSQRLNDALFPPRKRATTKAARPKTTPLTRSARGEACTVNIAGVCSYATETVVLAHLPKLGDGAGMGRKVEDFCACYACHPCHDALDGRGMLLDQSTWLYYASRALVRTLRRMADKGLILIKGVSE